jgi:hypothetical protein
VITAALAILAMTAALCRALRPHIGAALAVAASLTLAIGVWGASYWVELTLAGATPLSIVVKDVVLIAGAIAVLFCPPRACRNSGDPDSVLPRPRASNRSRWRTIASLAGALFLLERLIMVAVAFLAQSGREPEGSWDAWSIWNLRARFLFGAGRDFRRAFDPVMAWSHPDYPLMLPGLIAQCFALLHRTDVVVPALFAAASLALTAGICFTAVARLRGVGWAMLALWVLLGAPQFTQIAAEQLADVPVAMFALLAVVMVSVTESPATLLAAGAAASMAAWTKNEGMLHLVAVLAAVIVVGRHRAVAAAWFIAGALPILLILLHFKLGYAPANDLVAGTTIGGIARKVVDGSRYARIAAAAWSLAIRNREGWSALPLALVVVLAIGNFRRHAGPTVRRATIAVAVVLLGFFVIYLLTPLDLKWQLDLSLDRLFCQMWPTLVFAVVVSIAQVRDEAVVLS